MPLHIAAQYQCRDIAALLLEAGADIGAQSSKYNYQPLHLAEFSWNLELMKLLLQHGAPIDSPFIALNDLSITALYYTCKHGKVEIGRLLLDYGADLERQAHYGIPLTWAALGYSGMIWGKPSPCKLDMVLFLLKRGTNAEAPTPNGNLLSDIIPTQPHIPLSEFNKKFIAALLAYGASRDTAMERILLSLTTLAQEAEQTEDEYLAAVTEVLDKAEKVIPSVLAELRDYRNL
ncbi:ankyrin repeat-containing domain protein [Rhodocollybia butyracea]|uniref:Ankyrin repeat-containing domain protein n=1 Tax=Rhodocollybia butyracea TaxID=206335 RepID=A0A9P5PBI4_9AGAR|nr:ankyrin repeat-containing domain protein [Rhodocollybia butyracea]